MTRNFPPSFLPRLAGAAVLLALAAVPAPGALAQTKTATFGGGLKMSGDQPLSIEANQLDVDDASAVATFSGDVSAQQGDMRMKTDKLVVQYAKEEGAGAAGAAKPASATTGAVVPGGSSRIERLDATGKVTVQSADQVATSQKATFDMTSQIARMTGDVVLTQGQNIATGCILTIQMNTGKSTLQSSNCNGASGGGGRVKVLIDRTGQPAASQ